MQIASGRACALVSFLLLRWPTPVVMRPNGDLCLGRGRKPAERVMIEIRSLLQPATKPL
jgi:hypothetical protein